LINHVINFSCIGRRSITSDGCSVAATKVIAGTNYHIVGLL